MTVRLRKKLAKVNGLVQALRILEEEPEVSGSLRIKGVETEGVLAIDKGRITGAVVGLTGECGEAALARLAAANATSFRYSKRQQVSLCLMPLDISFQSLIDQLQVESGNRVLAYEPGGKNGHVKEIHGNLVGHEDLEESPHPVCADDYTFQDKTGHKRSPFGQSDLGCVSLTAGDKATAGRTTETDGSALQGADQNHGASQRLIEEKKSDRRDNRKRSAMIDRIDALFGTIIHLSSGYRALPVGEFLGVCCLGALVVSIFIVPARIKNSIVDIAAARHANENLTQSIDADLVADVSQESAELAPRRSPSRAHLHNLPPVSGDGEIMTEDLRFSRWLTSKGKQAAAIPYYETYLRSYPDSVKVRIELIDAYIAANRNHDARVLCIRTLKQDNLRREQIPEIWQHMQRCQTD